MYGAKGRRKKNLHFSRICSQRPLAPPPLELKGHLRKKAIFYMFPPPPPELSPDNTLECGKSNKTVLVESLIEGLECVKIQLLFW